MPRMAAEMGFEVEFITFNWPGWLHHETEKQRVMWAYKILFLDVSQLLLPESALLLPS